MASKNIEVDSDSLRDVYSKSQKELSDALTTQTTVLATQFESLSEVWEGPNYDAFMEYSEVGMEDLRNFIKATEEFFRAWKAAYEAYEACEDSVSELIG